MKEGMPLIPFALCDHRGNTVTEKDLTGTRSVLWFYPKADTPG
jgi:peroxiredoxin